MLHGEKKSGGVIFGDMILKWKQIWSQVAAALRSLFRQKGPTSARTFRQRAAMNARNPRDTPLTHR